MSADIPLTQSQRDDLVRLLALFLPRPSMRNLAEHVLGTEAKSLANAIDDMGLFAQQLVDLLHQHERLGAAFTYLQRDRKFSRLQMGLQHILNGKSIDADNFQAFVNEYEPFLKSKDLLDLYPRLTQQICAVGLGAPFSRIVGSGFLIAPDLVMTNFHVLVDVLGYDPATDTVSCNGLCNDLYFFFDYLAGAPPTIPPAENLENIVAVKAAPDWLVHARRLLQHDGTLQCANVVNTEYDYAVVRLAEPIGDLPVRSSSGAIRGWLELHGNVDVLTFDRRILVFQHPGTGPQMFDMGDYVKIHASNTRVWYSTSTAKGSSGGAAVDKDGKLFALHNAEVDEDVYVHNTRRVNQGIRIDYIHQDLSAVPGFALHNQPAANNSIWSITDDPLNPAPVIGRREYCKAVTTMQAGNDPRRVISVTGPAGTGKNFSIELLRRLVGPQVPLVVFSERELQTCTPTKFVQILVQELGLSSAVEMPQQQATEAFPRWLRVDLPQWLLARLVESQEQNVATYPRWVVIDTVATDNRRLLWAEQLRDFLVALLGGGERGQPSIQLTQLRWLFLSETSNAILLNEIPCVHEDLSDPSKLEQEFAECVALAFRSLNKPLADSTDNLKFWAETVLAGNEGLPQRQVLARVVRRLLENRGVIPKESE